MAWQNIGAFDGTLIVRPVLVLMPNGARLIATCNNGQWREIYTGENIISPIAWDEILPIPEAFANRIAYVTSKSQELSELVNAPLDIDEKGVVSDDALILEAASIS